DPAPRRGRWSRRGCPPSGRTTRIAHPAPGSPGVLRDGGEYRQDMLTVADDLVIQAFADTDVPGTLVDRRVVPESRQPRASRVEGQALQGERLQPETLDRGLDFLAHLGVRQRRGPLALHGRFVEP